MFCFDLREAAPRYEAFCSLRTRAESSTRLPNDQSWLKYYLLNKRFGLRDPFDFKVSAAERSPIPFDSLLSGDVLGLTAHKCDSSMAELVEVIHRQFGAARIIDSHVVKSVERTPEGNCGQKTYGGAAVSADRVTTRGRADQKAGRRTLEHRLQKAGRFPAHRKCFPAKS
jgi:hypothetical protein